MTCTRPLIGMLSLLGYFFVATAHAQVYAPPEGGWAYTFAGDAAEASDDPFMSLDGTWDHQNSSDAWDGSEIGDPDGMPGGVSALSSDGVDYVRLQDPGDPRDTTGESDPSNRKVYFTHNLASDFEEGSEPELATIIDDGVTLYFRARVATAATGPIDQMHADGSDAPVAWPAEGIGYSQHNSGKSMFAIKQTDGANVAFGLDYGQNVNEELAVNADGDFVNGLTIPHLLQGNDLATGSGESDPSRTPDLRVYDEAQIYEVDDVTQWQEFWITIEEGVTNVDDFDEGTHIVSVYANGMEEAVTYGINAASGSDYRDGDQQSYIAIGAGATPRAGAFDVDFFSWAPGLHVPTLDTGGPTCAPLNDLLGDLDGDGSVAFSDFLAMSANFGSAVDSYSAGDVDCDGNVAFSDFLALSANFGKSLGEAQSVPEPSGLAMSLFGLCALALRRRR